MDAKVDDGEALSNGHNVLEQEVARIRDLS